MVTDVEQSDCHQNRCERRRHFTADNENGERSGWLRVGQVDAKQETPVNATADGLVPGANRSTQLLEVATSRQHVLPRRCSMDYRGSSKRDLPHCGTMVTDQWRCSRPWSIHGKRPCKDEVGSGGRILNFGRTYCETARRPVSRL